MQLLMAGTHSIFELAFAPDGRALVAPRDRSAPVLWELPASGEPVAIPVLDSARRTCSAFTFSPDAQVVGWLCGQTRYEFDRRTGATQAIPLTQGTERVNRQRVCGPDGRLIVRTIDSSHADGRIRAFTARGGAWAEAWTVGPSDDLRGWQMTASGSETFFTWEQPRPNTPGPKGLVARSTLTGEVIARMTVPVYYVAGLAAKPDGSAVVCYKDSSLYYWPIGEKIQKVRTGTLKHYRALAFHPDGRHLLAGNNDATARLIDTHTWQITRQFAWNIGRLVSVAVSPDGTLAAAGGERGRIVVWDLDL